MNFVDMLMMRQRLISDTHNPNLTCLHLRTVTPTFQQQFALAKSSHTPASNGLYEMPPDVTPPPLQGPTAKERRYDRQLRLWAANGQQALEEAHVLLLNNSTGVVGVETLKNLVLPGIGSFTIVDGTTVTEADLGVNFFLEQASLGKSRATECTRLLRELNPEVNGIGVSEVCLLYLDQPVRASILIFPSGSCLMA